MDGFLLLAFLFLIAGVVAVPIASRLGLGSVLGYLLAGIVISPILGWLHVDVVSIQHFAEFGVVMMLFLVGLELEPRMLWEMRNKLLGLGGLLARAILGDALLQPGESSNTALSMLFVELFPGWLAALLGIGILAAVMSTADGLVVSSSQIIANDLYRCTIVPRLARDLPERTVDRQVLIISRIATVAVMAICTAMAWALADRNVALIVWIGTGGMMAAFAGPLVVGAVWRGVTKAGAFAGLLGGVAVFSVAHGGLIDPGWFEPGALRDAAAWLLREAPNPWSCAAMGEIVSIALTWGVSKLTQPLPSDHLTRMFGAVGQE